MKLHDYCNELFYALRTGAAQPLTMYVSKKFSLSDKNTFFQIHHFILTTLVFLILSNQPLKLFLMFIVIFISGTILSVKDLTFRNDKFFIPQYNNNYT